MKNLLLSGSILSLALCGITSAQIVSVGPFTGDYSEGFETQNHSGFLPCVTDRVFSNTGDLCTPGNSGCSITGSWSFYCVIYPHGGSRFFGSAGGYAEYTFDTPVQVFGGYFGNNTNVDGGWVEIYDAAGNLLGNETLVNPADCSWTWNGWESQGAAIARVATYSNSYSGPFVMMDDMEYNLAGGGCGTFDLTITGDCMTNFDVVISNGNPGARCAFAYSSDDSGTTGVPPCPGLVVCLTRAKAWAPSGPVIINLDNTGGWSFNKTGGPSFCGMFVQAVDLDYCEVSTVEAIP